MTFEVSPKLRKTITAMGLTIGLWQIINYFLNWHSRIDMEVYRAGARAFIDNKSLYESPFDVGGIALPFIYPPFGAAILTPFALMSDVVAGIAIILMSAALTFLCIFVIARALMPRTPELALMYTALIWPLALLSEPHTQNANFGQINVLVMALCVLDLVPRKRFLPQGTLIGIAAAIKLTPVMLCLYFLLRKDFKAIGFAALSGVIVTALAACIRLSATKEYFLGMLLKMNSTSGAGVGTAYLSNQSIKGMLARWAPSEEAAMAHQGLIDTAWLVIVLLAIALCAHLMLLMLRRGMLIDAGLVNAGLMLMISPISWTHHWVWMPLFAMALIYRWVNTPGNPVELAVSGIATWLFCLQIKPQWIFGDLGNEMFQLNFGQKFILSGYLWLMIAILISLYVSLLRGSRRTIDS
ncbi:glycosyltransferase family 87 protein [Corynebacterium sp. H128]|uniref:glycosyltransferase family 87 protein n=1 Tax=Corynebacterium sp. H128 TaxID=3133427 RepID=UPI003096AB2F